MGFIDFIKEYSGWGAYNLVVFGLIYAIKYLHKENTELKQQLQDQKELHYNDLKEGAGLIARFAAWLDSKKYGQ
jgi:hypothetical protein